MFHNRNKKISNNHQKILNSKLKISNKYQKNNQTKYNKCKM
jgi:hypothetical protein